MADTLTVEAVKKQFAAEDLGLLTSEDVVKQWDEYAREVGSENWRDTFVALRRDYAARIIAMLQDAEAERDEWKRKATAQVLVGETNA